MGAFSCWRHDIVFDGRKHKAYVCCTFMNQGASFVLSSNGDAKLYSLHPQNHAKLRYPKRNFPSQKGQSCKPDTENMLKHLKNSNSWDMYMFDFYHVSSQAVSNIFSLHRICRLPFALTLPGYSQSSQGWTCQLENSQSFVEGKFLLVFLRLFQVGKQSYINAHYVHCFPQIAQDPASNVSFGRPSVEACGFLSNNRSRKVVCVCVFFLLVLDDIVPALCRRLKRCVRSQHVCFVFPSFVASTFLKPTLARNCTACRRLRRDPFPSHEISEIQGLLNQLLHIYCGIQRIQKLITSICRCFQKWGYPKMDGL